PQALPRRELVREPVECRPQVLGRLARLAENGQVLPHLAVAAVDRLMELLQLAPDARGVALQEHLARLHAEVDARERLDEAVVEVPRDPAALLDDGELLGLLLETHVLEAGGRLADEEEEELEVVASELPSRLADDDRVPAELTMDQDRG